MKKRTSELTDKDTQHGLGVKTPSLCRKRRWRKNKKLIWPCPSKPNESRALYKVQARAALECRLWPSSHITSQTHLQHDHQLWELSSHFILSKSSVSVNHSALYRHTSFRPIAFCSLVCNLLGKSNPLSLSSTSSPPTFLPPAPCQSVLDLIF